MAKRRAMGRVLIAASALAVLGACTDDREFTDPRFRTEGEDPYGQYLAAREAALRGEAAPQRTIPRALPLEAPTPEERIAAATYTPGARVVRGGRVAQVRGQGAYVDPVSGAEARPAAAPARPAPQGADRVATAATVTAAEGRPSPSQTLIRYALTQQHAPGTAAFNRSGGSTAAAEAACARYANAAAAQLAFIAAGGPQNDPLGLDPDGDGFVCGWNPEPYRIHAGL